MAGITVTNEKGCLRLYRTFSYRDSNNKPQRVRKALGKIDPKTGKPLFNHFFKGLLLKQNLSLEKMSSIPLHEIPNYVDFGSCTKEDIIKRHESSKENEDYITYKSVSSASGINKDILEQAVKVLANVGLTINEAVRLFLIKVIEDKDFIYDFFTPNAETLEAMQEIESGGGAKFSSLKELLSDLESDK
jgi:DNA-damage-inducible protein J